MTKVLFPQHCWGSVTNCFTTKGLGFTTQGLRFTTQGLRFTTQGLRFATQSLRFTTQGLRFTTQGLRFTTQGLTVFDNGSVVHRAVWLSGTRPGHMGQDSLHKLQFNRAKFTNYMVSESHPSHKIVNLLFELVIVNNMLTIWLGN